MPSHYPSLLYLAVDVDYPGTKGGSTHIGEAVDSFRTLCNHVYLLCRHAPGQSFVEYNQRLTILRVPIPPITFLRVLSYFLYSFFISLFLLLFRNVQIVYERARIFGGGGILAGALFGRKTVYELIEPYLTVPVLLGEIKKDSFLLSMMRSWHHFITNRARLITVTHTSSLEGITHQRVIFIHTGANPQRFKPQKSSSSLQLYYHLTPGKTLLYVGSFSPWHACEYLLQSVARLVRHDKHLRLLMVGHGQKYQDCVRLAERLQILPYVHFIGKIPLAQIPDYINASDICLALFDRHYPPFKTLGYYYSPLKVHEYKACGKVVVASDYPLLRELVHHAVHGYTVDETDISALTATLSKLLRSPSKLKKMGANNRRDIISNYTWDRYNRLILNKLFKP